MKTFIVKKRNLTFLDWCNRNEIAKTTGKLNAVSNTNIILILYQIW